MFDIWCGNVELTTLACILSVAILLPVQLLLCFKVKSLTLRLLPVLALSALTAVLLGLACTAPSWDNLGYALLAILTGTMLLLCGAGWAIWAVIRWARK